MLQLPARLVRRYNAFNSFEKTCDRHATVPLSAGNVVLCRPTGIEEVAITAVNQMNGLGKEALDLTPPGGCLPLDRALARRISSGKVCGYVPQACR